MSHPNGPPPLFTSAQAASGGGATKSSAAAMLNLDDIFGDVMFTPDGDTVFLSEQREDDEDGLLNSGEGDKVATMASKPDADGQFHAVNKAGGLYTTQLHDGGKPALTMGVAVEGGESTAPVPFKKAPQASHHLQYAAPKKKRTPAEKSADRKMSEQQKVERRYVDEDRCVVTGKMTVTHRSITVLMLSFPLSYLFTFLYFYNKQQYIHTANAIANTPSVLAFARSFCSNRYSSRSPFSRKKMKN